MSRTYHVVVFYPGSPVRPPRASVVMALTHNPRCHNWRGLKYRSSFWSRRMAQASANVLQKKLDAQYEQRLKVA